MDSLRTDSLPIGETSAEDLWFKNAPQFFRASSRCIGSRLVHGPDRRTRPEHATERVRNRDVRSGCNRQGEVRGYRGSVSRSSGRSA
jgi:hypothetical protein